MPSDEVETFSCRSTEQTNWLRQHALQSASTGTTRVFVVSTVAGDRVVAYYAWCMTQIDIEAAPMRFRTGSGRSPQPVALLARLGVDVEHEGRGIGAGLRADAITRLLGISEDIGCRGLLIHAESADARDLYPHLIPDLQPSPTDELHWALIMKDATLQRPGS